MAILNNNKISLNEIRLKAQEIFLTNPFNAKAKKVFLEACLKELVKEDDSFDLFGAPLDGGEDDFRKKISGSYVQEQRNVVDPSFGMKAAMCLGEATELQNYMLKFIEDMGYGNTDNSVLDPDTFYDPYTREKGQIDTGQPGTEEKIGARQSKYDGVLKDLWKAKFQGSKSIEKTTPIAIATDLTKAYWVPFNRSKLANAISSNSLKGTISPEGAGEMEFLARMYYSASKGLNETLSIASSIKMAPGVTREMAEEQESFLLNLGDGALKSKIADRCKAILEVYLILVAEKVLQPVLKFENVQEYAYEGVQHALRKLVGVSDQVENVSNYDFDYANIGAWAYTVVRNYAIDQLKGFTDLKFDNSRAAEFAYGLSYPVEVTSKIEPDNAVGQYVKSYKKQDKTTGELSYVYIYDDKIKFIQDLQRANGFEYDIDDSSDRKGRKRIYQKNNPLYFKNLSTAFRSNFMTSSKQYLPTEEETTEMITPMEKKEALQLTTKLVNNIKGELNTIAKDIINKVVKDPNSEKYGQNKIKSFMSFNSDLSAEIIQRMFVYGIYKFVETETIKEKRKIKRDLQSGKTKEKSSPKGQYEWMTKPEEYLDDFIKSLEENDYMGQGLPSEVTNKQGKKTIDIKEFVQLIRKVILGSGTEGPELERLFKAGKENSEEFRKLVSSKGFLLQNPSYIKRIYSLLRQLPAGSEYGTESSAKLDENITSIHSLINELKSEFKSYKKQLFNKNTI